MWLRSDRWWSRTLADEFSPRANSIGFLRLLLATAVLVAHSAPLGYGRPSVGLEWTHGQLDIGGVAVYGFFALSGFLITASGMRFSIPRYAWHRFLRIFPGFWACLVVTALLIAPFVAWYERGTLAGFWTHPAGPFDYLVNNALTGMRQWRISDLLDGVPFSLAGGGGQFNGSLWSLIYELVCYVMVAVLAWTGVLSRAPRVVVVLTAGLYLLVWADFLRQLPDVTTTVYSRGHIGPFPLIGTLTVHTILLLFLLFLAGASAYLYQDRIPMSPVLAAVAAVTLVGSAAFGGFVVLGMPAFVYLTLWAACRLPAMFHGVGRRNDYSYGVYIYAYPVQQVLALVGVAAWGVLPYLGLTMIGTALFAVPSWHLVEKPAMRLKDWTPGRKAATGPSESATGPSESAAGPSESATGPSESAAEPTTRPVPAGAG